MGIHRRAWLSSVIRPRSGEAVHVSIIHILVQLYVSSVPAANLLTLGARHRSVSFSIQRVLAVDEVSMGEA